MTKNLCCCTVFYRWLGAVLLLLAPRTALCEDRESAAAEHLKQAWHFADRKEYVKSAEEFRKAYILSPETRYLYNEARAWEKADDPEKSLAAYEQLSRSTKDEGEREKAEIGIVYNRARDYEKKGETDQALEAYNKYIGRSDNDSQRKENAEARIRELEGAIFSALRISCSPEGGKLTLDGNGTVVRSTCPWSTQKIKVGTYTITVDLDGYHSIEKQIQIDSGETHSERLKLVPFPGHLLIRSSLIGFDVSVDGSKVGKTPEAEIDLDPGTHRVNVSFANPWSQDVVVTPGSKTVVEAVPVAERSRFWWWVGGGLAAAGIASAVLLPIILSDEQKQLDPRVGTISLGPESR